MDAYAIIWRIDSLADTTIEQLIINPSSGTNEKFEAIGIDQINGFIYAGEFVDSSYKLYKSDLDGNSLSELTINYGVEAIGKITGIVVDSNGILYISGQNTSSAERVFKYNPANETVVASYSNPNFVTLFDVMVKDDYVYLTNLEGPSGWNIIRLNKELGTPMGYGTNISAIDHSQGAFYGPRRFVAITNKKITIVDDNESGGPDELDKLISMDDMVGNNWNTFPDSGDGIGFFDFYHC